MKEASEGSPFVGDSEMAALMRELDWSATALGPVRDWSEALNAAVRTCLATTGFPMVLLWGPQLVQLYNDGYRVILGDKHPTGLGQPTRECWPEVWEFNAPIYAAVRDRREVVVYSDQLFPINRSAAPEEAYFTLSYGPVVASNGEVGGVLVTVIETTGRVLGERRLSLLRQLGEVSAARATSVEKACVAATQTLGEDPLDVPFALVYLLEGDSPNARLVAANGVRADEVPGAQPSRARSAAVAGLVDRQMVAEIIDGGAAVVRPDIDRDFPGVFVAANSVIEPHPVQRAVLAPLCVAGRERPVGLIALGASPFRPLNASYRSFFDLVAGQVSAVISDVSAHEIERSRAESLAELDRAKTAFFTNVSHELRTPLTLLLGPVEDALADTAEPLSPAQRRRAEVALRNAQRLLKLVNTLLDFSRLESGQPSGRFEATDLARYTAELASMFSGVIEQAGLGLAVDTPPLAEGVYVDREMWAKIVLNLLSNAVKFTAAGSITVRVGQTARAAELVVADTGVGIEPSDQARLFERFHRSTSARAGAQQGTGIGLALVAELAAVHGGTATVTSTPGEGSEFAVRVPLGSAHLPAEQVAATASTAALPPGAGEARDLLAGVDRRSWPDGRAAVVDDGGSLPAAGTADRSRVLVADDNPDMLDYVAVLLRQQYAVQTAADGTVALERALADPPDLVLADVMMPRLDGFGLLAALREDARTQNVPVVMLSARAGPEGVIEGLQAGADDYVAKPFSSGELLARVRANLELERPRRTAAAEATAREHRIADRLQRSLLPPPTFEPEYLEVATYYRAGVEGTQVGGDWYDVIKVGAGRTALVIGDVMGRGIHAAAVMGQLRSAARAYARLDLTPIDVLEYLDEAVRDLGADQIVTCVYAVYDPVDRSLDYANAGHLPPVLASPGHRATRLTEAVGQPLGTGPLTLAPQRLQLPAGGLIALFTDGLVERRGRDLDTGLDVLAGELDPAVASLADLPDALVSSLVPGEPDDDVAILLARSPASGAQPTTARRQIPFEHTAAADARDFAASMLAAWSLPAVLKDTAVLVTSELVTNAVAYGGPPIELRLRRTGEGLVIEVHDQSVLLPRRLRPTPEDEQGRGLQLVSRLADRWGARPTADGKSVWCVLSATLTR